jgi:hypothetical protein
MVKPHIRWTGLEALDRRNDFMVAIDSEHRALIGLRLLLILHWRKLLESSKRAGVTGQIVNDRVLDMATEMGISTTRRTLYRWWKDYQIDGPFALTDGRRMSDPRKCRNFVMELSRVFLKGEGKGKPLEFSHRVATDYAAARDYARLTISESRRWAKWHFMPATGIA